MIKVADIRSQNIRITKEPIVYFWWLKTACFEQLFKSIHQDIDLNQIKIKELNKKNYGLLYIGKGKNGNDRLVKYHILDSQNFHTSGVKNGRLSSLRQTLCGLLNYPMSTSQIDINNFMDENCIIEFKTCVLEDLNNIEKYEIMNNYLPLNHQHTKGILTPKYRKILSTCKKNMKY
jgi:hypothetical protein